jgi:hypothetical protein
MDKFYFLPSYSMKKFLSVLMVLLMLINQLMAEYVLVSAEFSDPPEQGIVVSEETEP